MVDTNLDKYTIIIEEQDNYTIELNEQGPQGLRGPQGEVGPVGPQGEAATISIGTVTTGEEGSNASVVNRGTSSNAVLDFEIPRGDKGDTGPQGISVTGVEEISKIGLVSTYRMYFSNDTHFDYQVTDGSIDALTREEIINIIGYEPASYISVEGLTTRVSTLEQRVEDLTTSKFPNVVIIGTPHIEGGQVSNFSNTNYLQFPFVDISRGLPFDIYFSFTTGSDVVTQQNILDSHFGIALAIQNGRGVMALSSNGSSWDIGNVTGTNTILPNTTYYVKCGWTGTQYTASLSTNDTTYVPDIVLNSTLTTNKTTIFIGGSPDLFGTGTAHPFKGTINFNNSRVDVQGTTVWEGMADVGLASRANVSLNNLDEVGEDRFNAKQDVLISATNIKTINGESVLGSGDIEIKGGGGLEVCDIGMALYVDETKGLRRYLNGQIVDINANTQAFLNRLKEITTLYPSLLCTEDEWQTAKTMSAFGQVGKFVFNYADDGVTVVSVRIPRVVNIQGLFDLQNLGMTVSAGLPNITGGFSENTYGSLQNMSTGMTYGAFTAKDNSTKTGVLNVQSGTGTFDKGSFYLDASRSNLIYGKSNTVQPEAIQYPYFIQIATGSETENNIVNDIELNNPFSLFDSKYSDHELNNLSWLKSEGQWNSKTVYPTAYDKLLKVYNGTETVVGLSVKLSTEAYTNYDFVLNTADETFRLPLSNNQRFVIETHTDGTNGYRIWSDGYCEQWGIVTFGGTRSIVSNISLLKSFKDTNYIITSNVGTKLTTEVTILTTTEYRNKTNNSFTLQCSTYNNAGYCTSMNWKASGYLAEGEYTSQNLNLYYYVGETVQNANLIDAGRIGEQLAGLANKVDVSNTQWATNACIPDYSAGIVPSSGFVCPTDGLIHIVTWYNGGAYWVKINNIKVYQYSSGGGQIAINLELNVSKGDVITFVLPTLKFEVDVIHFYPLKGAN